MHQSSFHVVVHCFYFCCFVSQLYDCAAVDDALLYQMQNAARVLCGARIQGRRNWYFVWRQTVCCGHQMRNKYVRVATWHQYNDLLDWWTVDSKLSIKNLLKCSWWERDRQKIELMGKWTLWKAHKINDAHTIHLVKMETGTITGVKWSDERWTDCNLRLDEELSS
jgi:hypothetical protein